MKLTVKRYKATVMVRSWAACQENRDDYEPYEVDRWMVLKGKRILREGIETKEAAERFQKAWELSPTEVHQLFLAQADLLDNVLADLKRKAMKQMVERKKLAVKRCELVRDGKKIPDELTNLSGKVSILTTLRELSEA